MLMKVQKDLFHSNRYQTHQEKEIIKYKEIVKISLKIFQLLEFKVVFFKENTQIQREMDSEDKHLKMEQCI